MTIPAIDLQAQYKSIKNDIDAALKNVITNAHFVGGKEIGLLEEKIASLTNTKYAVALNSGTDALYLALLALEISKDDEVITSPFTFFATAEVICLLGAKPVFVDINPQTFNIDETQIEKAITKRTKAIMPVHMFGLPANMSAIRNIAKQHEIPIVEDACQAIAATYKGKPVGGLGTIGCFSFYPTKNLGAWGDGGMITTNNTKIATTIRMLRNHGSKRKYFNDRVGISSRLDTLQAAVLLAKLPHLNKWTKRRQSLAHYFNRVLKGVLGISTPFVDNKSEHVYNQYTIRLPANKRDKIQAVLKQNGIASIIYYPIPLHIIPALAYLGYDKEDFPEALKASQEVLSLPLYPELKESQIDFIAALLKQHVYSLTHYDV